MTWNSRTAKGFTLLELLLVMAVNAILAALLLPTLSGAKARVRRTACLSNLRQINLAIRIYSDDSNDAMPSPGIPPGRHGLKPLYTGYRELIKGYVGLTGAPSPQDRLFACPADMFYPDFVVSNTTAPHYVQASLHDHPFYNFSSYTFNGGDNIIRKFGTNTNEISVQVPGLTGLNYSSVKHPARTVLIGEVSAISPWSWHDPSSALIFNDAKNVVSFVDGHVSYVRIYWNSSTRNLPSMDYNPPAGYDYQWSGD